MNIIDGSKFNYSVQGYLRETIRIEKGGSGVYNKYK